MDKNRLFGSIPKVDEILNNESILGILDSVPRVLVLEAIREVLDETRTIIKESPENSAGDIKIDIDNILETVRLKSLDKNTMHLKKVINCTGVIIHTNLGRSVLSENAAKSVYDAAVNYSNLEYDLEDGNRGSRYEHIEYILKRITGAESAIVVNNNAAAVLVVLSALCRGKEAVVSRGELVEIGGSFRIPEVMEQSGAVLKEVGATNMTHLYDYENAINENTGVLLKVHTSNYRILGFTESVCGGEIACLGKKYGIPVVEDIGSGSFIDFSKYGISYEPIVQDAVKSGIDIVTFSGDKMLGGPQAGIIAGKKKYVDMIRKNPLTRAIRVDKMTLAALEATLREYLDEDIALNEIPTLRMITESKHSLSIRAEKLLKILETSIGKHAEINISEDFSQIGGGSMPLENLPTFVICMRPYSISVNRIEQLMREAPIPVVARTKKESILFDIRTIREHEYQLIGDTLKEIFTRYEI